MPFIHLKTLIILVLCLIALPAFADIYEYIDEAGIRLGFNCEVRQLND